MKCLNFSGLPSPRKLQGGFHFLPFRKYEKLILDEQKYLILFGLEMWKSNSSQRDVFRKYDYLTLFEEGCRGEEGQKCCPFLNWKYLIPFTFPTCEYGRVKYTLAMPTIAGGWQFWRKKRPNCICHEIGFNMLLTILRLLFCDNSRRGLSYKTRLVYLGPPSHYIQPCIW